MTAGAITCHLGLPMVHHPLLDVRGLPPPEPLLRILEATARLQVGEQLIVHHERLPSLLYPRLDERGLTVETRSTAEGLVILTISRPLPPATPREEHP
ncbi:MAG: DUF2249 domain-containing protein [Magnetococcus sp. WYHC-3]